MTKFTDLGLNQSVLRAVEEGGYETMTPIQQQAIPAVLNGKDLIAIAQTGTGKTAAFSLPLIQKLLTGEGKRTARGARALILAPTRELAMQISENIRAYGQYLHLKTALIFGGASAKPQIKAMTAGVDILIATPGRLLDLMNQRHVNLGNVEYLVLDEADRMLDMGFIRDIQKIIAQLPTKRQTLLFSATMPTSVEKLANSILTHPIRIEVAPAATTAEKVAQHVLMVPKGRKRELLAHVLKDESLSRVLIFTRTKHGANRVSRQLEQLGISSAAIHGNKSQNARQKALNEFRAGETRALVATDVAARGIDVDGVTHVINFEIPNEPESYVHRIGRTARAGATGSSLSFCDHEERAYLKDIEKSIRQPVPVLEDHPFHAEGIANAPVGEDSKPANGGRRRRGGGNGRSGAASGNRQNNGGGRSGAPKSQNAGSGRPRQRNRRPQRAAA
ncbi:DEAD/DEAH box helicase [uncultured Sneathiella sp.]|uniref:DEAD/DEAH box helicase n=1 Tax=uncultured Sneathiella sp. TaxID=879315 RepID=UPI0030EC810D|tara:strand:+ start:1050 stop:2393 length:1344 start_codon:yes stop_codon:yes gene_type:complete